MITRQQTLSPTEADLEAEIRGAINKAFPWLPAGSIRHQIKFSFTIGRANIEIDGARDSAQGRTDILVYWNDTPLAVFELKRKGTVLTPDDDEQGLSYANVLRPRFPLVVITNGDAVRLLESHSGKEWRPTSQSEAEFHNLLEAASRAAGHGIKDAISILMGSNPAVWMQAVRSASDANIEALSGTWHQPLQPFVRGFLFPRKAAALVQFALEEGKRFLLIEGAPLVGKSSLLREMVRRSTDSTDMAVLFIPADEGSGIFQAVADLLTTALAWPVTAEEARIWLARLSRAQGPALVLAVDGLGPDHQRLRSDLEALSSTNFGKQLRLIVTIDDSVTKKLTIHSNDRQASSIGRRVDDQITLELLDDDEFEQATKALWDHRMAVMHGAKSAPELRVPWILRALGGRYAPQPAEKPNLARMLPAQLSLDLINHTRERFSDDELRRQFREIAKAVLRDAEDVNRPIALMLESLATFVVRRQTLRQFLELNEIESLISRGFLKPVLHASGEAVLVVRLPELLASEASRVLASDLIERASKDSSEAARWLVASSSRIPLGDIIAAYSFADAARGSAGLPFNVVSELVAIPPRQTPITPGMEAVMHVPGIGMMKVTFQADGSVVGELNGRSHSFPADPNEATSELTADSHAWLILSHLAGQRIGIQRGDDVIRVDLGLLRTVGAYPHILRRPDSFLGPGGVLKHDIPEYGEVVCHAAGIVEPITFSLYRMLSTEGPDQKEWIQDALDEGSLALLTRMDIALRETAKLADDEKRTWAERTLAEQISPALDKSLECNTK